jgi:hypothetical protein
MNVAIRRARSHKFFDCTGHGDLPGQGAGHLPCRVSRPLSRRHVAVGGAVGLAAAASTPRPGLSALGSLCLHAREGHHRRAVALRVFSDACPPAIVGGQRRLRSPSLREGRRSPQGASPRFTSPPAAPTPAAPTCATHPSAAQSLLG